MGPILDKGAWVCFFFFFFFMFGDISSQILEVMEVEITGKRKKGRPKKLWEECVKKDLEQCGLSWEERMCKIERNGEGE